MGDPRDPDPIAYPREVFLLGAGFSAAAHPPMPTVPVLGRMLRRRLLASAEAGSLLDDHVRGMLSRGYFPSGDVEMWLSSLAETQPFMSPFEAARNQAIFQWIIAELRGLVLEPQQGFWKPEHPWLPRLLRLWHRRTATVVTFNYDTIVEESMRQLDAPSPPGLIVPAILTYIPRDALEGLAGRVPLKTFRLLKLHGSVDWVWNPEDRSGDTLRRVNTDTSGLDLRGPLAGKEPFIVPPLAAKSSFYSLGVIRQLWADAANALKLADRIVIIGYSVPLTDLATTAMLSRAGNPTAEWHIVDSSPMRVKRRLVSLGVPSARIQVHKSVEDWVQEYERRHCERMSADLAAELRCLRPSASSTSPVAVQSKRGVYGLAKKIRREPGQGLVIVAREQVPSASLPEQYVSEADLVEELAHIDSSMVINVEWEGANGECRVLGALDPEILKQVGGAQHWCGIEAQNTPTPD